jgi:MATE family multidrug resistance protein
MAEVALNIPDQRSASSSEWRALIAIAIPVVTVQVGMMLMGTVDTLVIGHLSAEALAAVALGNVYTFNVLVIAMGALMALDPVVAQAVGAGDSHGVTRAIQRGIVLAIGLSIVTMLTLIPAEPVLRAFRQPASVVPNAALYVHVSAAGFLPFLLFVVLRQSLQAIGRLAPIVITIVIANVLNAFLNWVLIFGHLGAPPLGVTGSAIGTAISRWTMCLLLIALAWPDLREHLTHRERATFGREPMMRMLALGLPIGVQQFLEVSAFNGVGLLMGTFGAIQVAAHQIAINLAALTFMVPLGVSASAAVRVGHAVGAGDAPRARRAARIAYILGAGFMCTTGALFLTAPSGLARLFTTDAALIALAASLIPIAGVFQIFDGLQAVGAGVCRGLGDTRVPLLAMLLGYWLIGLPVSVGLGFSTRLGPRGLWWGFVAGLATVAAFLLWRVLVLFRRGVSRVHIDASVADSMSPVTE